MAIELTGSIAPKSGSDMTTVVNQDYIDFSSPTASKGLALLETENSELGVSEFLVTIDSNGNVNKRTRTNAGGATKLNDLTEGDGAVTLSTTVGGITLSTDIAQNDTIVSGLVLSEAGEITKIGQATPGTGSVLKWDGSKWAPGDDTDTGVLAGDTLTWTGTHTFSNEVSADGGLRVDDTFTVSGSDGDMSTSGTISTTNSTASTSTSTGALVVTGGMGVGGDFYPGEIKGQPASTLGVTTVTSLSGLNTFSMKDSQTNVLTIQPATDMGGDVTMTFPSKTGTVVGSKGDQDFQTNDNELFKITIGDGSSDDKGFEIWNDATQRMFSVDQAAFKILNRSDDESGAGTALFTLAYGSDTLAINTTGTTFANITTHNGGITAGGTTIATSTGNITTTGILDVNNSTDGTVFEVGDGQFTVNGSSGNTAIAGDLTITGLTSANGGITSLNSTDVETTGYYFTSNADSDAPATSAWAGFTVQLEDDDNTTGDETGVEKYTALVYSNVLDEIGAHGWCMMPKQALTGTVINQNREHILTATYQSDAVATDNLAGVRGEMRINSAGDLLICVDAS